MGGGKGILPTNEGLAKALKPELDKVFKPAFLGRLVIIPDYPIGDEAPKQIIRLKLGKIERPLLENHRTRLEYADLLIDEVAGRFTEVESGARNSDNILTNTLLPEVSPMILARIAGGDAPDAILVSVGESGTFAYSWEDATTGAGLARRAHNAIL